MPFAPNRALIRFNRARAVIEPGWTAAPRRSICPEELEVKYMPNQEGRYMTRRRRIIWGKYMPKQEERYMMMMRRIICRGAAGVPITMGLLEYSLLVKKP
jgi:hypothetical protein